LDEYATYGGRIYISEHTVNLDAKPYTVELKLLGEKPETADLEAFYAAAEAAGFSRDQFVINDKGTADYKALLSEDDKRLEIIYRQQQTLEEYRAENKLLRQRIDSLESALRQAQTTASKEVSTEE